MMLLAHTSDGNITVAGRSGRAYRYLAVSPYQVGYVKKCIAHKSYGRAWKFLKQFECIMKIDFKVITTEGHEYEAGCDANYLLDTLQQHVGGYIQIHPTQLPEGKCVVVNEEGLLKQLPVNETVSRLLKSMVVGNCVIMNRKDLD